jgi:phosphomethylpyrimidine synthase
MNQLEAAVKGVITPEMKEVALAEGLEAELIRRRVEAGQIVILKGRFNEKRVVGIGKGLRTKINASIGTSTDVCDVEHEKAKARIAEETGADTLMELSAAGDLDMIRREVLSQVSIPVGNVPLYQAFCETIREHKDPAKLDPEFLFELIERQCEDGMAFMAIHCGINLFTIERMEKQGYRYGGLCSKGGTLMIQWMVKNNRENPLYEQFDRVCDILKKYDTILSLGNGIRAGAIHDSLDRAQMAELILNCELAEIARRQGCQAMVEGPGHVPLDEIEANIILQKKMSNEAPYYMLGPLPCDVGAGLDHITAAIGAAHSSMYGADLICYITPAEHLALPNEEDVEIGVKTARLAAHIGDVVKLKGRADERDKQISKDRRDFRWARQFENMLFAEDARRILESRRSLSHKGCSMCGELCALKNAEVTLNQFLYGDKLNIEGEQADRAGTMKE